MQSNLSLAALIADFFVVHLILPFLALWKSVWCKKLRKDLAKRKLAWQPSQKFATHSFFSRDVGGGRKNCHSQQQQLLFLCLSSALKTSSLAVLIHLGIPLRNVKKDRPALHICQSSTFVVWCSGGRHKNFYSSLGRLTDWTFNMAPALQKQPANQLVTIFS